MELRRVDPAAAATASGPPGAAPAARARARGGGTASTSPRRSTRSCCAAPEVGSAWSGALPDGHCWRPPGPSRGLPRENPVLYFHDGDDVVLVASSFGRDKHPAWYHNLPRPPGGHAQRPAVPRRRGHRPGRRSSGSTRLAVRVYPGYADYRVRTAAVGRRIPVPATHPTLTRRVSSTRKPLAEASRVVG